MKFKSIFIDGIMNEDKILSCVVVVVVVGDDIFFFLKDETLFSTFPLTFFF